MQFERQITKVGGSLAIMLPPDLITYLELTEENVIVILDEKGKKGKYFSCWKKEK